MLAVYLTSSLSVVLLIGMATVIIISSPQLTKITETKCPDLDSTNLTVALRSFDKPQLYKPKMDVVAFQRHLTVTNLTENRPIIVSVIRDSDMKTLFLMHLLLVQTNGTYYTSIWMK